MIASPELQYGDPYWHLYVDRGHGYLPDSWHTSHSEATDRKRLLERRHGFLVRIEERIAGGER